MYSLAFFAGMHGQRPLIRLADRTTWVTVMIAGGVWGVGTVGVYLLAWPFGQYLFVPLCAAGIALGVSLAALLNRATVLGWFGIRTLPIYLLHQPLIGAVYSIDVVRSLPGSGWVVAGVLLCTWSAVVTNLFRVENRLRYLMGIAVSDGRLIRPVDEPTTRQVHFDWPTIHAEALATRAELRRGRWQIKRRELELIAARNSMLPRLDAVGRYRWLGVGDELIDSNGTGVPPFLPDSNAFEVLTSGDYQEWELGLQFTMPIGFRRAMTAVRHHQLLLARERAVLQDLELEVSHQLADAVRDVDLNYGVAQTNFNRRAAADDEVDAVETLYQVGQIMIDRVLDAQSRQAEAESAYYRSLVDYNRAIMRLHFRKGSLLEYNGVYLAEGPWPGKAYFDALRRARQRDASLYVDYGYTRPGVISRGPHPQINGGSNGGAVYQARPTAATPSAGSHAAGGPGAGQRARRRRSRFRRRRATRGPGADGTR